VSYVGTATLGWCSERIYRPDWTEWRQIECVEADGPCDPRQQADIELWVVSAVQVELRHVIYLRLADIRALRNASLSDWRAAWCHALGAEWVPPSRSAAPRPRCGPGTRTKGVSTNGYKRPRFLSGDVLGAALAAREDNTLKGAFAHSKIEHVKATHRAVHEALVGGPAAGGVGGPGCPWCAR